MIYVQVERIEVLETLMETSDSPEEILAFFEDLLLSGEMSLDEVHQYLIDLNLSY